MKASYFLLILLANSSLLIAQSPQVKVEKTISGNNLPQINYVFNRVFGNVNSFYEKLKQLKTYDSGVVRIVHIGDSHIQAGFFTNFMRDELQKHFGNAGRGLVFPYQVARTNAPADIKSSSANSWLTYKVTRFKNTEPGVSGYALETNYPAPSLHLELLPNNNGAQTFDKLKIFTGNMQASSWILHDATNDTSYIVTHTTNPLYNEVLLKNPAAAFSLNATDLSQKTFFYGVSLEKNAPGIMYHSIGVNGARYDQYNNDPLFWKQLPGLQADIFIVSLGTNDAQTNTFNEAVFLNNVSLFIGKLKKACPFATILLTTAGDSYKRGYPNAVQRQLNISLGNYCNKNNIGLWDLYKVTNGYGSAKRWYRLGLLSSDLVHYTIAGYELQAKLFFMALINGYNNYAGQ